MEIKIEKTFIGDFGIPLTLFCMNDKDPETYAKQFFRTGIEENDNFMIKDYGKYRGVNFVWQVMMDAKPEDIRKFFKSKDLFGHVDNFREDGKGTWQWEPVIRLNITDFVHSDIVKLLEKGIKLEINGNRGRIGTREGAYHFVGMDWFKAAYIQCYNEDNGIKKGCFITTAVCDSFGKVDDCYELTTFRHFRDEWLVLQPDGKQLVDEYYAVAPRIVASINRLANAAQIYKDIWREYLAPCLTFIELGDQSSCKAKYVDMVHHLKKLYL